jgi:predicted DNA repair protein MutK
MLLSAAPVLMKLLGVVGTVAMFMVGGGILTHGLPFAHDIIHHATEAVAATPAVGGLLAVIVPSLLDAVAGLIAGGLALVVVNTIGKIVRLVKKPG